MGERMTFDNLIYAIGMTAWIMLCGICILFTGLYIWLRIREWRWFRRKDRIVYWKIKVRG